MAAEPAPPAGGRECGHTTRTARYEWTCIANAGHGGPGHTYRSTRRLEQEA